MKKTNKTTSVGNENELTNSNRFQNGNDGNEIHLTEKYKRENEKRLKERMTMSIAPERVEFLKYWADNDGNKNHYLDEHFNTKTWKMK